MPFHFIESNNANNTFLSFDTKAFIPDPCSNLIVSYKKGLQAWSSQSCQLFYWPWLPSAMVFLEVTLLVTVKVSYHSPYQWKLALSLSSNLLGLKPILVILFFFTCKYNHQNSIAKIFSLLVNHSPIYKTTILYEAST